MKRLFDISVSFLGLLFLSPVLLILIILVWLQDFKSPFYVAKRIGMNGSSFNMIKLRSMVVGADKIGAMSTSANDKRITLIGHFIRAFKLDEFMQLWNVLIGDMSLVGPRPNTWKNGVELYTNEEKRLFDIKPGITDFASIVFSDEGAILSSSNNPDEMYNQLIRPWKSRLGLIYLDSKSVLLDIRLILITVIAIISRKLALHLVVNELRKLGVGADIISVATRKHELIPTPPPGSKYIYQDRSRDNVNEFLSL